MHVAFLYNDASEDPAQQTDDDPEHSPISAALMTSGHEVTPIACTLDLAALRWRLEELRPQVAFNRVDSLGGSDAMQAAVPMLLDAIGLPYTGCPAAAFAATVSKTATKRLLVGAGLPTPAWISLADDCGRSITENEFQSRSLNPDRLLQSSKVIIKADREHASFQLDDSSVMDATSIHDVVEILGRRERETGRPFFAEAFVEGREFNIALWGERPSILPPAEIDFTTLPAHKPRIVGQRAKWAPDSVEYDSTDRRFDFPPDDRALITRLEGLSIECWRLFGLRGYARIDFRVDATGKPSILEVNCNPCLAPEAGFAAALAEAGIAYDEAIERILQLAFGGSRVACPPVPSAATD